MSEGSAHCCRRPGDFCGRVSHSAVAGGTSVAGTVSIVDLFPTFAHLAGVMLPNDRTYDGQNIYSLLTGDTTSLPGPGIGGRREMLVYYRSHAAALRSGRYKYVDPGWWSPHRHMFDLAEDLGEGRNLVESEPELATQLLERLTDLAFQTSRGGRPIQN